MFRCITACYANSRSDNPWPDQDSSPIFQSNDGNECLDAIPKCNAL
jgi:hypothetical protein